MKLGLIGDVHAEPERLAIALCALKSMAADHILCTGDIVDGIGSVDACCELLENHRVITVRGNHERWALAGEMRDLPFANRRENLGRATLSYLKDLPPKVELETPSGKLLLCHGLGIDDMACMALDDCEYALSENDELQHLISGPYSWVFNGHTHQAGVRHLDGLSLLNAGTLVRSQNPCFFCADFSKSVITRFDLVGNGDFRRGLEWTW